MKPKFIFLVLITFVCIQGFSLCRDAVNLSAIAHRLMDRPWHPTLVVKADATNKNVLSTNTIGDETVTRLILDSQEPTTVNPVTTPESLIETAKQRYQDGQFAEALTLLQQAKEAFIAQGNRLGQAMTIDFQGQVYLAQGQPETAIEQFAAAATIYNEVGDKIGSIKSQINQAQALRKAGLYRRALELLQEVNQTLEVEPETGLNGIALRSLGITQRLVGNLDAAEETIEKSLMIAEAENSPEEISAAHLMLGNIAKDRGNALKDRSESDEAASYFAAAIEHYKLAAEQATTPTAIVEAELNQISISGDRAQVLTDDDWQLLSDIRDKIDQLPLSSTAVSARINWARLVMAQKNSVYTSLQEITQKSNIAQQLIIAIEQARQLKEPRAESYAWGQLGELRQQEGSLAQAQENTQQALVLAQSIGAADIAYRWQRQLGEILQSQGQTEDAIAAYQSAVGNLNTLRNDLVSVNPEVQYSFRDAVEPVYREFVELLLDGKGQEVNPENLEQARTVIESLQQAELVNFFRENCLTANPIQIDEIDPKAAVIYPIVLRDRLDVIASIPDPTHSSGVRLRHESIILPNNEAKKTFSQLREAIAPLGTVNPDRTAIEESAEPIEPNPTIERSTLVVKRRQPGESNQYLPLAQRVYDWVIRPMASDLASSGVNTLVFVLDTPLLNIPMAALHNGTSYLIEQYAIAYTPGLQLLDPKPLIRGELTALKAGITEERELQVDTSQPELRFPPLVNVERELEQIQSQVPGQLILNEQFTTEAIQNAIDSVPFPVIHLATHGQFGSDSETTFILTWDDRLNIDQLGQLLRGREEGGRQAIELLVLSACQTATDDEQATLGLAGIAVKAGARSTLATLWVVDDAGTAELMIRFYQELNRDRMISKAEALRRAQLSFIQQPNQYREPYFWAPFVLVGNWL